MIIGTGLIASELIKATYKIPREVVVYAKGVSNSSELDEGCYNRDQSLLKLFLATTPPSTRIFYISSCSVSQSTTDSSKYILSKLVCEQMVLDKGNGFVVRLPQVAGSTLNPNNFCGHIASKLINKEPVTLQRLARRNIIDIEHAALILSHIIRHCPSIPRVFNIATPIDFSVVEFFIALEKLLGLQCEKIITNSGSSQAIDSSFSNNFAGPLGISFSKDYPLNTMIKYYFKSKLNILKDHT